jgi:hypothetical protein
VQVGDIAKEAVLAGKQKGKTAHSEELLASIAAMQKQVHACHLPAAWYSVPDSKSQHKPDAAVSELDGKVVPAPSLNTDA